MAQREIRVGVVLSGCGYLDGSEIHEATLTLLALDRRRAHIVAAAPDIAQVDVVDHLTSLTTADQRRNVLAESARIARGKIVPLAGLRSADVDAAIFPGGYGAAKNLSSCAADGPNMRVHPDVARLVRDLHAARRPMGFICIAPVIAAKVLGDHHPQVTIGKDADASKAIEAMGGRHVLAEASDIVVDPDHRIVSTPAYMLAESIAPVAEGIDKLVAAILTMVA